MFAANLKRNCLSATFCVACLVAGSAPVEAQSFVATPNTVGWRALRNNGVVITDPLNDSQTGDNEGEFVGNATNPVLQTIFDKGSSSSLTDGFLYFRVRLGEDGGQTGYRGLFYLYIDANPGSTTPSSLGVDAIVGVELLSTQRIGIFNPGAGPNDGPSTTTVTEITTLGGSAYTYATPTTLNYNFSPVYSSSLDLDPGDGDNLEDLDGSGNVVGGTRRVEPDYYLSFRVSFQDLVTYLTIDRGLTGINENTAFGYTISTGQQSNTINQDVGPDLINGLYDFSDPLTPASTALPEPGTFALFTPLLFGAIAYRKRR